MFIYVWIQILKVWHLAQKTRMMLLGIAYGLNSIEIISHALDLTMNIPLIRAEEKRRGDAL